MHPLHNNALNTIIDGYYVEMRNILMSATLGVAELQHHTANCRHNDQEWIKHRGLGHATEVRSDRGTGHDQTYESRRNEHPADKRRQINRSSHAVRQGGRCDSDKDHDEYDVDRRCGYG